MGKQVLVVGLGNPGRAYAKNRHNLGFMVLDQIARQCGSTWRRNREGTLLSEADLDHHPIILAKPQTFMNLSGKAVWPLISKSSLDPNQMVVVHDDIDLVVGNIRIKTGGGDGGHRGVRSIADSLRFKDFFRVRLGVGRPPDHVSPDDFVLTNFLADEGVILAHLVNTGSHAVSLLVVHGFEYARTTIHAIRPPHSDVSGERRHGFSLANSDSL